MVRLLPYRSSHPSSSFPYGLPSSSTHGIDLLSSICCSSDFCPPPYQSMNHDFHFTSLGNYSELDVVARRRSIISRFFTPFIPSNVPWGVGSVVVECKNYKGHLVPLEDVAKFKSVCMESSIIANDCHTILAVSIFARINSSTFSFPSIYLLLL